MIACRKLGFGVVVAVAGALACPPPSAGQSAPARAPLDRVLSFPAPVGDERLDVDRGALGAWHRIRQLATTASLLHVTAHPDDEHSGMLALASRGWGARTALLSLNRGEAGANAIGPELFDALGLIRTRELVLAGRYYGLDDLYFTTAVDYGYSKSVDEAFRSWDRETVLEDMVRVIRLNRPLVVVSRFHGSARDGHGHHHAAGLLTPEAVAAAADPARFPDQITGEGLRPWRVLRTFRGGVRAGEPFHVEVDATGDSPWLGDSYQRWASRGLALQRSQTAGRVRTGGGRYLYERRDREGAAEGGDREAAASFFAGLDVSLGGLPALLGEEATPRAASRLAELQRMIDGGAAEFDFRAPARSVPALVRGLELLRSAIAAPEAAPETRFQLSIKERQFEDAILAAAGVNIVAELEGTPRSSVLVPGQTATVRVSVTTPGPGDIAISAVRLADRGGGTLALTADVGRGEGGFTAELQLRAPAPGRDGATAEAAAPYFGRDGLTRNQYEVLDSTDLHLPWRGSALSATVELVVEGGSVAHSVPVTASVPRLPYGSVTRTVEILPALSVSVEPAVRIVPVEAAGAPSVGPDAGASGPVEVRVRITANAGPLAAETRLELPDGWTATPAAVRHDFRDSGETADASFAVTPPPGWRGAVEIRAVARAGSADDTTEYGTGFRTIEHRDLRLARLWRPARATVRSVSVARMDGARIGYVMGVGDEVPAGIEALGATVELLDEAGLAALAPGADAVAAGETRFDAIVIGTRAYAVREDLLEHNQRLLEYARGGGHLVVLYQTQEYVPSAMAPYAASLPRGAEEVSEEDAPVRLLRPDHPLMSTPNRITEADFDGWVEQRGIQVLRRMGSGLHPSGGDPRPGSGAAGGRVAHRPGGRGTLHVSRPRPPPAASVRRAGGVPHPLERPDTPGRGRSHARTGPRRPAVNRWR